MHRLIMIDVKHKTSIFISSIAKVIIFTFWILGLLFQVTVTDVSQVGIPVTIAK